MARRKKAQEEQMKLFEEGGLKDEGGTVDPVSGNDVPSGSTQAEVRDDIPAQLSEGEFVFPADVVRYIGLENLMELRSKAKRGLAKMEAMGQMGNSDEATMDDSGEYVDEIDSLIDNFDPENPETFEFNEGGVVQAYNGQYIPPSGIPAQQYYGQYRPPSSTAQNQYYQTYQSPTVPQTGIPSYSQFVSQPAQAAATAAMQAGAIENRQYVGPNGEMITIRFQNDRPIDVIPEGYKPYDPETIIQPQIVAPTVMPQDTGGDGGDGPEDTSSTPSLGMTQEDIDAALSAVNKDLAKAVENKPTGLLGVLGRGIIGNVISAIQKGYYTQKAVTQVKEGFGLTNPMTAEYQNFRNEMSTPMAASVAMTEQEARDVASGERGLEGSSFGSQEEAEAVGNSGWGSDDHFDAIDDQFDSLPSSDTPSGPTGPGAPSGEADGPPGSGDGPSDTASSDGGQDQASADEAGGVSDVSPFSKGGAVQQTQRALKSARKKK